MSKDFYKINYEMRVENLKKYNGVCRESDLLSWTSKFLLNGLSILFFLFLISSKELAENKPIIVENSKAVLVYHLKGGMLKDFHLKENSLNPFQNSKDSLDNYGQRLIINASSNGSINEESIRKAKSISWDLTNSPIIKGKNMEMMMRGEFLEEKITVKRWITFPEGESLIKVKEDFLNYSDTPVSFDFLQQISLNPAIVKDAIIHSNLDIKAKSDYKKVKDDSVFGWIVIISPPNNLIFGYLFDKNSYSRIGFDSKASALLWSSGEGKIPLKSKEQISRSYVSFLKPNTKAIKEINSVNITNGRVEIVANGGKIMLEVGSVEL